MYVLKIENAKGDVLQLTQNEANYQIIKISGLNPPPAVINNSSVAGMDGSKFNSARLQERNIVITVKINGDVERNRLNLYKYLGTKQKCKIFYTNARRDVHIEGYVETIECDLFSIKQQMQISIICNEPYFKSASKMVDDISKVLNLFEFPFAIDLPGIEFSSVDASRVVNVLNESESETGIIIDISVRGKVRNPVIRNIDTGEYFQINIDLDVGDHVVIDTNRGSKSIKLIRGETTSNIFNKIARNSTWFQLRIGDNFFAYESEIGAEFMYIIFNHYYMYEGV